jgi:hypothetical protein
MEHNNSPMPDDFFKSENDKIIYAVIGKIFCDRGMGGPFPLAISISELSNLSKLSRPTIYKRHYIIDALNNFSTLDELNEESQKLDFKRKLLDAESLHKAQLEKIATEKIILLSRIVDLEKITSTQGIEINFLKKLVRR